MRKLFFTACTLLTCYRATAQPAIQWEKLYGGTKQDNAVNIEQTTEGGYIIGGYSWSRDGDVTLIHGLDFSNDIWLVKIDAGGTLVWEKSYGGTKNEASPFVQQTKDGGYIFSASARSADGNLTNNHGWEDVWVVKLDASGNISWQKNYGGSGIDIPHMIRQTKDGGYVVIAQTTSKDGDITNLQGATSVWVLKLDAAGNISWQKTYGGTVAQAGNAIEQTADGGYIIAASAFSNDGDVTGHHGSTGMADIWVVKLDATGNISWQKSFGGSNTEDVTAVHQTSDGNYLVAGYTKSSDGDVIGYNDSGDAFVLKIDASGTLAWAKTFGGKRVDIANSVIEAAGGSYTILGCTFSNDGNINNNHGGNDAWVINVDKIKGTVNWSAAYGGTNNDLGNYISPTADGSFVTVGSTNSNDGDLAGCNLHQGLKNESDIWVTKFAAPANVNNGSLAEAGISVFPTITSNKITIVLPAGYENATVTLYDITGRYIKIPAQQGLKRSIDFDQFSPAVYLLSINNNGIIKAGKIVYQP